MIRRIIALAVDTGIAPSVWFDELERDERVVLTALDVLHKSQQQPAARQGGPVTSG